MLSCDNEIFVSRSGGCRPVCSRRHETGGRGPFTVDLEQQHLAGSCMRATSIQAWARTKRELLRQPFPSPVAKERLSTAKRTFVKGEPGPEAYASPQQRSFAAPLAKTPRLFSSRQRRLHSLVRAVRPSAPFIFAHCGRPPPPALTSGHCIRPSTSTGLQQGTPCAEPHAGGPHVLSQHAGRLPAGGPAEDGGLCRIRCHDRGPRYGNDQRPEFRPLAKRPMNFEIGTPTWDAWDGLTDGANHVGYICDGFLGHTISGDVCDDVVVCEVYAVAFRTPSPPTRQYPPSHLPNVDLAWRVAIAPMPSMPAAVHGAAAHGVPSKSGCTEEVVSPTLRDDVRCRALPFPGCGAHHSPGGRGGYRCSASAQHLVTPFSTPSTFVLFPCTAVAPTLHRVASSPGLQAPKRPSANRRHRMRRRAAHKVKQQHLSDFIANIPQTRSPSSFPLPAFGSGGLCEFLNSSGYNVCGSGGEALFQCFPSRWLWW